MSAPTQPLRREPIGTCPVCSDPVPVVPGVLAVWSPGEPVTITEFLLARYAEDESDARIRADAQPAMAALARERFGPGAGRISGAFDPARVLAECEAKRRIITQVSDTTWGSYAVRDVVLGHLAAVYADHPDYDKTWGP